MTTQHQLVNGLDGTECRRTRIAAEPSPTAGRVAFGATFLAAWFALDRLTPSPPTVVGSVVALAAGAGTLAVGERISTRSTLREIASRVGLRRPAGRGLAVASVVGAAVVATFVGGAAVLGIELQLRSNWPAVLAGAFIFHGIAEELVWRGYVYGRFRRRASFGRAVVRSMPLIALTHVPIVITNGPGIGVLAVLTAIVTCLPFSRLYDLGGRTIWAPAILHGSVGMWQLFERSYPVQFSLVVLAGSIVVPLTTFAFGDRSVARPLRPAPDRQHPQHDQRHQRKEP